MSCLISSKSQSIWHHVWIWAELILELPRYHVALSTMLCSSFFCKTKQTLRKDSGNRTVPPFQALRMIFAFFSMCGYNTQLLFVGVFLSDHKCISYGRKWIPHIGEHWKTWIFFSHYLRFCWTSHWEKIQLPLWYAKQISFPLTVWQASTCVPVFHNL